jgi:hypothetical protein
VQEFSGSVSPPKLFDFDRLTFRRKDVDAIEKCKPHRCDFQVFDVTAFQKQINWNSSVKYEQVNKLGLDVAFFDERGGTDPRKRVEKLVPELFILLSSGFFVRPRHRLGHGIYGGRAHVQCDQDAS